MPKVESTRLWEDAKVFNLEGFLDGLLTAKEYMVYCDALNDKEDE